MGLDDVGLDAAVRTYGAKGAVLDYIRRNVPDVPIEPFVMVPVHGDWQQYRSEINELGECLVRSSSPSEDGKRLSFAGLFATEHFTGQPAVDKVLASLTSQDVLRYKVVHGIEDNLEMGLVFQRRSSARWNYGMIRHPHQEHLLFVMGRRVAYNEETNNFVYDETTGTFQDVDNFCNVSAKRESPEHIKSVPADLVEAIEHYKVIEQLPAFQTGYSYHMEFGTEPLSIYQFRPFKKKEKSSWRITTSFLRRIEKN